MKVEWDVRDDAVVKREESWKREIKEKMRKGRYRVRVLSVHISLWRAGKEGLAVPVCSVGSGTLESLP